MLRIPLAEEKCEGPGTLLTFLGIHVEVNTVDMTLSLPATKLEQIQRELEQWSHRKSCRHQELVRITHRTAAPCSLSS